MDNEESSSIKNTLYIMAIDVLLNGLSISDKGELQSLCCMMGKTMSLRCHLLAANGWQINIFH